LVAPTPMAMSHAPLLLRLRSQPSARRFRVRIVGQHVDNHGHILVRHGIVIHRNRRMIRRGIRTIHHMPAEVGKKCLQENPPLYRRIKDIVRIGVALRHRALPTQRVRRARRPRAISCQIETDLAERIHDHAGRFRRPKNAASFPVMYCIELWFAVHAQQRIRSHCCTPHVLLAPATVPLRGIYR